MTREEKDECLKSMQQCKIDCAGNIDGFTKWEVEKLLNKIYDEHEAEMKQAYIDGSNSCNELIQSLYKQVEQLKDKQ